MSDDGSTDERSALAWIMSGTVGALVVGGFAKRLIDKRRERALTELGEQGVGEQGVGEQGVGEQADAGSNEHEQADAGSNEHEQDDAEQDVADVTGLDEAEGHPT